MKLLFGYVKQYYLSLNKNVFLLTTLLVAIAIVLNYTLHIESRLGNIESPVTRVFSFFLLYAVIFGLAYFIHFSVTGYFYPKQRSFYTLLVAATLTFAFKIGSQKLSMPLTAHLDFPWNRYWQIILDWPLKAAITTIIIYACWKTFRLEGSVAGMTTRNFEVRPYLILLLLMVPLIAFAATQADFLHTYPKVKNIAFATDGMQNSWKYKLLYELSYGSDFFGIELFFRGFLVLAFARYVGKDAILPMAAFYCAIHFGKPLLECISSYAGGILLGVIVFRTRSIWGGLLTHLGIAWLMELAGTIASS